MTAAVWSASYDVNTLVVNQDKRLGLVGLLNILQDIAWIHGSRLGFGYEAMLARHTIWVLTRQKLTMAEWPPWGDRMTVRTWVNPSSATLALRDYEVLLGERSVGACTASWLTLDATTRRPARLAFGEWPAGDRSLGLIPAKIAWLNEARPLASFEVRNSDLDVNGHVNNTRYAQWILDAVPPGAHLIWTIDEYEVNFLAETGVGERVAIAWDGPPDPASTASALQFQGHRESDGKSVFAARLRITRRPGGGT